MLLDPELDDGLVLVDSLFTSFSLGLAIIFSSWVNGSIFLFDIASERTRFSLMLI
jgi:hypothetical protein